MGPHIVTCIDYQKVTSWEYHAEGCVWATVFCGRAECHKIEGIGKSQSLRSKPVL